MSQANRNSDRQQESGDREIDRRFLDENAEGQQEIVDAATSASEKARAEPDSPEQRERTFGVEDPSHSRGSARRKS